MKQYIKLSFWMLITGAIFVVVNACKKPDHPQPSEGELITTIQLLIGDSTQVKAYNYTVLNGMNVGGTITVDSIILNAGKDYPVYVNILNEQANPVDTVTHEILLENEDHLFIWQSTPGSGAGSLIFSGGNIDSSNKPLNQAGHLTTGTKGTSQLTVILKHLPTNKYSTNPDEAGGATDAAALFPVRIEP